MKNIQPEERKMKPQLSTAILLAAIWSFNHNVARAQDAPPTALPALEAPPTAVAPQPALDQPVNAQNAAAQYELALPRLQLDAYYPATSPVYSSHAGSGGPATVIQFSQPDPRSLDAMQEDLNVMSLLLQRKLEDAVGENSPTYRMGIPLLLRSGQRSLESLYLDGFGALFTVNVNFPLLPPPAN